MDRFLFNNGKLVSISQGQSSKHVQTISGNSYTLDTTNRTWIHEGKVEVCDSSQFEVLRIACVDETTTGLRIPVILLHSIDKSSGDGAHVYFLVAIKTNCQELIPLKKLKTKNIIDKKNCFLLQGPALVWVDKSSISLSIQDKRNPTVLHELEVLNNLILSKVLWVTKLKDLIVVLGYCQNRNPDEGLQCTPFLFVIDLNQIHIQPLEVDVSLFFPKDYTNILCVNVKKCQTEHSKSDEIKFQTELYAVTEEGYILKFCDGVLLSAVPTGIIGAYSLHVLHPFSTKNEFVIVEGKQTVSSVNIKNNKIDCSWSGIRQVICGDFVGYGSSQILLLTDDSTENWKSNWLLTDLGVWHINLKDQEETEDEEIPQNTTTAINALSSRLQNELVLFKEKRATIIKRDNFIAESWQRLQDLKNGEQNRDITNQYDLVSLINCKQETAPGVENNKTLEPLKLIEVWQRVFDGKWIVGVDIINNNNRTMLCPFLTLIPDKDSNSLLQIDVLTRTKNYLCVKHCDNSNSHLFPKRRKLDQHTSRNLQELAPFAQGTVIAFTQVPKFGQLSSYKCHCLVSWYEKNSEEGDINKFSDLNSKEQFVGEISLTLSDVLTSKYSLNFNVDMECSNIEENRKDLEALNAVQIPSILHIQSVHSVLTNIPRWLKDKMGFQYSSKYMCYVSTQVRPLSNVRVIPDPCPRVRKSSLTIYTSTEEELCLFVHHLYACSPDDIIVLQDNKSNEPDLLKNAASCIREEMNFVTSSTKELLKGDKHVQNFIPEDKEFDEKGNVCVDKVRQNYSSRKAALLERTEQTLHRSMLKNLKQGAEKRQKETDRLIVDLTL